MELALAGAVEEPALVDADTEPALEGADEELALAGALGWSQWQPTRNSARNSPDTG